jgi:hypothetical protein
LGHSRTPFHAMQTCPPPPPPRPFRNTSTALMSATKGTAPSVWACHFQATTSSPSKQTLRLSAAANVPRSKDALDTRFTPTPRPQGRVAGSRALSALMTRSRARVARRVLWAARHFPHRHHHHHRLVEMGAILCRIQASSRVGLMARCAHV